MTREIKFDATRLSKTHPAKHSINQPALCNEPLTTSSQDKPNKLDATKALQIINKIPLTSHCPASISPCSSNHLEGQDEDCIKSLFNNETSFVFYFINDENLWIK